MAPLPLSTTAPSTSTPTEQASSAPKSKKRNPSTPHIIHTSTLRHPQYTYFHLTLTPSSSSSSSSSTNNKSTTLDPLLISQLLTQALSSYLGLTGAAIPVDILKSEGREVWIRVPARDARGVRAGLSSWCGKVGGMGVSWRVQGGLGAGGGGGEEIFGD
ncbi:hypothetical protein HBH70_014310 [Parastagonospora nodorum]|nr:hypothetical protein HBH53_000330 [Parastagonospora nodorum]KAH4214505.1 hypothetical protein HBI95_008910 [Parastagonospora nodorum]KAH5149540.1 hypothetical protein HBH70_014310 [Parastagonospora nodorum]KAH5316741.1 hypothetical protein HBI11_074390 [Parastagonospora nodorum]KAH5369477.1 hypothetical protein HBI48_041930 [Parastagonospora nodorum]